MTPYDVAVMFDGCEVNVHLVYAHTQEEALQAILMYYKDTIVIGVVFGALNKE